MEVILMKKLFLLGISAASFSCIMKAADAPGQVQVKVSIGQSLKDQFNVPAERNLFRAASVLATMATTSLLKSGFDGYSKALILSTGTLLALAPILRNVYQPQAKAIQGQENQDAI